MATFRNDYQDIFGEEVNDFEGFSREELDFNSDIEVEQYSENESEDSESQNEDFSRRSRSRSDAYLIALGLVKQNESCNIRAVECSVIVKMGLS